jgi:hypothetical protein
MKVKVKTVKPAEGDVQIIKIVRRGQATRLAIYDGDHAVPLIQATLSALECIDLRQALGERR